MEARMTRAVDGLDILSVLSTLFAQPMVRLGFVLVIHFNMPSTPHPSPNLASQPCSPWAACASSGFDGKQRLFEKMI
jgi:hypothetical protein